MAKTVIVEREFTTIRRQRWVVTLPEEVLNPEVQDGIANWRTGDVDEIACNTGTKISDVLVEVDNDDLTVRVVPDEELKNVAERGSLIATREMLGENP